jgi:hypothetical protein
MPSRGGRVAWIEHRQNGWLVRWRDQGKGRSKKFRNEDEAVRFKQTVEEVRLPGTDVRVDEQGYFWAPIRRHEAEDPAYSVEQYAKAMIEANQGLADTTRALYRRTIRTWIEGTDVGRADVRYITPEVLERWWASLPSKPGALRNVAQLLSVVLRRAVKRGLRESNPLDRTDIRKPPKSGPEERPLTTSEVEALADAAVARRDRLEILVMAYGGLRCGSQSPARSTAPSGRAAAGSADAGGGSPYCYRGRGRRGRRASERASRAGGTRRPDGSQALGRERS